MSNTLHIGQLIERKVKEAKLSNREFADLIPKAERSLYDLYKRDHIRTDELVRIGEVLNYDFFKHYSDRAYQMGENESENEVNDYAEKMARKKNIELLETVGITIHMPLSSSEQIMKLLNEQLELINKK